jgi:hypothetical protein
MVSDTRLKQGDFVKIHNWHGVVLETHFDESGSLSVIRVQTARNLFRGYGPEYIDVRLDPDAVSFATLADLEQEIETQRRLQESAVGRLLQEATVQREAVSAVDL